MILISVTFAFFFKENILKLYLKEALNHEINNWQIPIFRWNSKLNKAWQTYKHFPETKKQDLVATLI